MYESPIKVFQTIEQHSGLFDAEKDKLIFQAVQGVCVNVDKDELLKALAHDRQQYQKGYQNGSKETVEKLIEILKMNCFVVGNEDFVYLSDVVSACNSIIKEGS